VVQQLIPVELAVPDEGLADECHEEDDQEDDREAVLAQEAHGSS
jgi:hypothetical protein